MANRNHVIISNRITHDYEGVDFGIIWDVIENDLNDLQSGLEDIAQNAGE